MDDILKLNVGGRIILTTRGSLCAEGGSMLANKFDPASQFAHPIEFEGAIFIDRDPDTFKYILNYLRDGCRARFGVKGVDVKQLEADADYFGLVGLKTFCAEAHEAANKEERDMASTLRKIATSSRQIANKIESISENIEGIADSFNTEAICDAITNMHGNSNTEAICDAITDNCDTGAICGAIENTESKIEDLAEVLKDGLDEIKDSISNTNHTDTAEALTNLADDLKRRLEGVENSIYENKGTTIAELTFQEVAKSLYIFEDIKDSIDIMTNTVGQGLNVVANIVDSAKMPTHIDESDNRSFRRERSQDSHRERDHHGREDSRQRRRRSQDPSL